MPCQPTCVLTYRSDCVKDRPIIYQDGYTVHFKSLVMAYQEMQGGAPPGKQSPLKDEMADPLERNSVHLQHMKALDTVNEFYSS